MGQVISAPGIGLALPQYLYPTELQGAPYDMSGNRVALAPGDELPVPAGTWYVNVGMYCSIEFLDPVTGRWSIGSAGGWTGPMMYVKSDGFNVRVANRTGCPIAAGVAAYGSGYVQATTTITQTPGNGTWLPIVGGQLILSGGTLTSNGAGYGVAPIVLIPPPPSAANNANGVGGVPATGYATIASGTVSGFTFTNPGAGYPTAPVAVVVPNPTDPNINVGITQATITFTLTGSGSITGAFNTNPGAPLSNPNQCTLTVAGAGSSGSLTALSLQTVTTASVTGAGSGAGFGTVSALLTTVGGSPPTGSIANGPDALQLAWRPRPAQIGITVTALGTISTQLGTIYDGGLFLTNSAPGTVLIVNQFSGTGSIVAAPTLSLTMGGVRDVVTLQPAP